MNREDFIKGLADLNKPDQGMRYHGGGFDHDAPAFDDQTGERLPPRHKDAELTLHGRRAQFIYRLIEGADTLATALSAQPVSPSEGEAVAWRRIGQNITMSPFGEDIGNAVISPEEPQGPYWTLIAQGGEVEQNAIGDEIVRRLNAAHPASDQSDTERMRAERENEIIANAMCLFRAFIGGSASRDVQNGTMTKEQADSWRVHAIRQHEESLRDLAGVAALAEKEAG